MTDVAAPARHVPDWRAMLAIGLEAMDETATLTGVEARTGRSLASAEWSADAEREINCLRATAKRDANPTGSAVWR